MNESRKQIIINEIIYWKKNRMLPEHYCDFLLALYTKGNGLQDQSEKSRLRKNILLLFILIPIGIFLFYFTELSLTLQIVFGFILIIMGILLTFYSAKRGMLFQIPLIMTAFLLLFVSVQITVIHTSDRFIYAIYCFSNQLFYMDFYRFKIKTNLFYYFWYRWTHIIDFFTH